MNRVSGIAAVLTLAVSAASGASPPEEPILGTAQEQVIHYETSDGLADAVTLLQKPGSDPLSPMNFEPERGYLRAVLQALQVPVSSQTLVFSKTSSQRDHTSPKSPRAIYFKDDVIIGWAPDAPQLDVISMDPNRGPIFYTVDQTREARPKFTRRNDCMECHLTPKTINVPGLVVRSVYAAPDGTPLAQVPAFVNGHNSPLPLRWGGWYVTGTAVGDQHLGNLLATDTDHPESLQPASTAISTDLTKRFDTARYLSPHSDIVALLVLEHQVRMQNLLTRASYETRFALAGSGDFEPTPTRNAPKAAKEETYIPSGEPGDSWFHEGAERTPARISLAGELLLEYMLYRNEAALGGPVKGTSGFAEAFQRLGPFDAKGRSLREFDLSTRLFRYPCSFLVYSPAFDALPTEMKSYLWRRLDEVLTGQDRSEGYAGMAASDRQNVLEILRDTKPEFAAWLRGHP
jgi:hypothetical protein